MRSTALAMSRHAGTACSTPPGLISGGITMRPSLVKVSI